MNQDDLDSLKIRALNVLDDLSDAESGGVPVRDARNLISELVDKVVPALLDRIAELESGAKPGTAITEYGARPRPSDQAYDPTVY